MRQGSTCSPGDVLGSVPLPVPAHLSVLGRSLRENEPWGSEVWSDIPLHPSSHHMRGPEKASESALFLHTICFTPDLECY